MQPSSVPTYRRAWKLYNQFSAAVFKSALVHLPISSSDLSLFIAYMFEHHYAASTANTYVSALGYCHRLAGVTDPTKVFWIIEILKGYGKLSSRADTRLPITLPILRNILTQTPTICPSLYRARLFTAMCTTAFFAFLRVGELTFCPRSPHVLQLNQVVQLVESSGHITGLKITFTNFKHSYNQNKNISITLSRRSDICPVQALLDYLAYVDLRMVHCFEHEMGRQCLVNFSQTIWLFYFVHVAWIRPGIKVTVLELGQLLSLRNVAFPMPKFV